MAIALEAPSPSGELPCLVTARWRMARIAALAVAALLATLILGEIALRVASGFASNREAEGWRPGAKIKILAVGDSHTYGVGASADQSYPWHLQQILDAERPGEFSVVNVGVPGLNTSQVRNRLAVNLARWSPDMVIFWCGTNNSWNMAEQHGRNLRARLDALLLHSRMYRFLRVWWNDRGLTRELTADLDARRHHIKHVQGGTHEVPFFGEIGTEPIGPKDVRIDEASFEAAYRDYAGMMDMTAATGARSLFVRYQFDFMGFRVANEGLARLAARRGATFVDAEAALERVPKERRYSWALHPSGEGYLQVAQDLAAVILGMRAPAPADAASPHP